MLAEFGADFFLVANENQLDIGKITQGLNGARDRILRGKVPSHGVEGDFHPGIKVPAELFGADRKNLPFIVVTASWASDMAWNGHSALRAFAEFRGLPAVGRFAGAQAHLRGFAFGNSHKIYCFFVFNFSNASHADACSGTESRLALGKPLHEARHFGPPLLSHLGCAGRVR